MNDLAIRVDSLGKKYRIRERSGGYKTLRESMTGAVAGLFRNLTAAGESDLAGNEEYWALKNVAFSIGAGEVVGIIGRNGAGKSTLLKILAGITEPTEGIAEIYGRIGSLLEVGTGFHPELTGRENVYLNGAILGMPRATIRRRFDEIVSFAEVEKFIDTPVKHYSSGMYMRLAFAVAAHLETDILLVDEVLAVGDLAFQEKCLGKMGDISRGGRTVLFVSHNMASIANLCERGILMQEGRLEMEGSASEVVGRYVASVQHLMHQPLGERKDRNGNGTIRFTEVECRNARGEVVSTVSGGEELLVALSYESRHPVSTGVMHAYITFVNQFGTALINCGNSLVRTDLRGLPASGKVVCRIPRFPLVPGTYSLTVVLIVNGQTADKVRDAAMLHVIEGDYFGSGKLPDPGYASVMVDHRWFAE